MQSYMHMCCQARAQLRLEKNGEIELIQDPISSERGEPFGGTSIVALEGSDEPLAAEPRGERCVSTAAA